VTLPDRSTAHPKFRADNLSEICRLPHRRHRPAPPQPRRPCRARQRGGLRTRSPSGPARHLARGAGSLLPATRPVGSVCLHGLLNFVDARIFLTPTAVINLISLSPQHIWRYVGVAFHGEDVAQQLPQEAKRFEYINSLYIRLMQVQLSVIFVDSSTFIHSRPSFYYSPSFPRGERSEAPDLPPPHLSTVPKRAR